MTITRRGSVEANSLYRNYINMRFNLSSIFRLVKKRHFFPESRSVQIESEASTYTK